MHAARTDLRSKYARFSPSRHLRRGQHRRRSALFAGLPMWARTSRWHLAQRGDPDLGGACQIVRATVGALDQDFCRRMQIGTCMYLYWIGYSVLPHPGPCAVPLLGSPDRG